MKREEKKQEGKKNEEGKREEAHCAIKGLAHAEGEYRQPDYSGVSNASLVFSARRSGAGSLKFPRRVSISSSAHSHRIAAFLIPDVLQSFRHLVSPETS